MAIYPPGSYDPSLDIQLAAAQRGLYDTGADYLTQTARGATDYATAQQQINQGAARNAADLGTQWTRAQQDLGTQLGYTQQDVGTQRTYAGQDRQRNLDVLNKSYTNLAGQQRQGITAAGGSAGGALVQAAQKRASNQAFDQQPIDTQYGRTVQGLDTTLNRAQAGYNTAISRGGEDYNTGITRNTENQQSALGQAALGYTRSTEDQNTALLRAAREAQYYGLDINKLKAFQAGQSGFYG